MLRSHERNPMITRNSKLEIPKDCSGASGNYDHGINGIIGQSQFLLVLSLTLGMVILTRMRMTFDLSGTFEGTHHLYETRGLV
ncbi:hypothetical protein HZH66_008315 [Vespula vulgaris]|uniref:Uncharacterized protein n=1 Tax=Vespula vulgaris TaxID=7454 RepID=A0A834JWY1_VESVU|nr:hypothetical protein HZH66_008315 [Vespula vulgaris]